MGIIAKLEQVSKEYKVGDQTLVALQPTSLEVREGELLLIIGPSGSGKTTLLSLLGCVIYPTAGKLYVEENLVNDMSQAQLSRLRLHTIGFVFQNFNLLAPLNAAQNIAMPLQLMGQTGRDADQKVKDALELVGMTNRKDNLPKQLSGGQQQRIAIARALVTDPKLVLCDEPTASLDKDSIGIVMEELKALAERGKAVAVVTHDPRLKQYAHRILQVDNGIAKEVTDFN